MVHASRWNIARGYKGADLQWHDFSPAALRTVLDTLEESSQENAHVLPPVAVFTHDELPTASLPLTEPFAEDLLITVESGETRRLSPTKTATGGMSVTLPADLPLGYHQVSTVDGSATTSLIITPSHLELPPAQQNVWGLTAQVYALRSHRSWGIGDTDDLAALVEWAARQGADYVSINPIHAGSVTTPIENSPYLPSSRRYFSLLMLAVEALPEFAAASQEVQARIRELAAPLKQRNTSIELIDRAPIQEAKYAALSLLWEENLVALRADSFAHFVGQEGDCLADYGLWCALVEKYGEESPLIWDQKHGPQSAWASEQKEQLTERIQFHQWIQFLLTEQLKDAQERALKAGMSIGIVHDLAVGVRLHSADVWTLPGMMVPQVSVGAPPDNYNQLGQNWSQPPWHPGALTAAAYTPFIHMIRKLCSIGGGLRIDHILGLFRLWWIPQGSSPTEGVYVPYPLADLLKILVLEATRQQCVIIGEDLGTVPPEITELLAEFGLWGTAVLWYEYTEEGVLRSPLETRQNCMMTVSTHDMPPVSAYLAGKQVALRADLGILATTEDAEWQDYLRARQDMVQLGEKMRVWPDHSEPGDVSEIVAIHRLMWLCPAVAKAIALTDIAADQRSQNVPGTDKEYPNWCIPLSTPAGDAVLVEELDNLLVWQRLKEELFS